MRSRKNAKRGQAWCPTPQLLDCLYCLDRLKLPIQRVAFADEDVPPPIGLLGLRLADHREQLRAELWWIALEVIAHGIEGGLAAFDHAVADVALLVEQVSLGRVQAEVRVELGYVLSLLQGGPVGVAGVRGGHFRVPFTVCRIDLLVQGFSRSMGLCLLPLVETNWRHSAKNQCHPTSSSGTSVIKKRLLKALMATSD